MTSALSGLSLSERNVELLTEGFHSLSGLTVLYASTYNNKRFLALRKGVCQILYFFLCRGYSADSVYSLLEEILRIIVCLSFHILAKTDSHRSALGRIGKDSHGLNQSGHNHFRSGDSVPILAKGLKSIIGGNRKTVKVLQLL